MTPDGSQLSSRDTPFLTPGVSRFGAQSVGQPGLRAMVTFTRGFQAGSASRAPRAPRAPMASRAPRSTQGTQGIRGTQGTLLWLEHLVGVWAGTVRAACRARWHPSSLRAPARLTHGVCRPAGGQAAWAAQRPSGTARAGLSITEPLSSPSLGAARWSLSNAAQGLLPPWGLRGWDWWLGLVCSRAQGNVAAGHLPAGLLAVPDMTR